MKRIVLIVLCVLLAMPLVGCGGSAAQTPNTGTVTFCMNVDTDGNAIDESSTFKAGEVFILFKTKDPFNVIKIKQTIYKIDGDGEEIYYEQNIRVKRDWFMIWGARDFSKAGKYRVEYTQLTNSGRITIGEGLVTIF